MQRPGWTPEAAGPLPDPTEVARHWLAALVDAGCLPTGRAELEALLARLAAQLVAQLDGRPADPRAGQQVGAALVAADLTSGERLGRSIKVLTCQLLSAPASGHPARVADLLGQVATGFAQALRERTLDQQVAVQQAALTAQQQAEAALRESEAQFRHQATHDPLTGLANRTLFTERLAARFAADPGPARVPRRLAVCFIDLDGFKVVNDTLGHHVGDLLLTAVAGRLRRQLSDHLVARLGGDEFVVLVEDTTCPDDAIKVADTALAVITEPTSVDGHELAVSASIGVVERSVSRTCPTELMRAADLTLQWAKSQGKGRWAVFDPERNQRELARYALSAALPGALDRGELFLVYQPIVSLADGTVQAVEALVRWRHPELGVLGPDQFLRLAAETGLVVRLGGWVLAEACQQARRWEQWSARPPPVSVNLAPRQVRDPGLVDAVTAALARAGLPPHRLQLEITEPGVGGADPAPVRSLHRLAEHGVGMAVDGFGSGFCNLPLLRSLPVQQLKIAGLFLAGLPETAGTDPRTTTEGETLGTLVELAHTLGLSVVAEEVETAAQVAALQALGCDAAQGWRLGRPVPPDQLPDLVTNRCPTS